MLIFIKKDLKLASVLRTISKNFLLINNVILFSVLGVGCSSENIGTQKDPQGTIVVTANGEDFVREGFTTKDGWQIKFDRVMATLRSVKAYQNEKNLQVSSSDRLSSSEGVVLVEDKVNIDLAAKKVNPIVVSQKKVDTGFYDGISWEMVSDGKQRTILLVGDASKGNRNIKFSVDLYAPVKYFCGEFIGEERKGMVKEESSGSLEMTFHFDHIFGDIEGDDSFNKKALGFQPLADLTKSETLNLSWSDLKEKLSSEDFEKLTKAIVGLGHVGEGHCDSKLSGK